MIWVGDHWAGDDWAEDNVRHEAALPVRYGRGPGDLSGRLRCRPAAGMSTGRDETIFG